MGTSIKTAGHRDGVSVITCTKRQGYLKNLLQNYHRQYHARKELIIVINHDRINLQPYQEIAKRFKHIRIFRLPERFSLGACLNYAVSKAKYSFIAKFDDDDYYAPNYLTDSLRAMKQSKADIVGKRAHYMYLRGSKTLILRFSSEENRFVSVLPGATLVMKRSVFRKVHFPHQNVGEDDRFCRDSKHKGFKIYSGSKYHFAAIRRKNSFNHTWIISDQKLLAHHEKVPNVRNFKRFVQKKPTGAK